MEAVLHRLQTEIKSIVAADSSGHDFNHLLRVMNTALCLQEKEGGDRLVLAASALLHDLHRMVENETGRFFSPKESLPQVSALLTKVAFPQERHADVLHSVEFHEEYAFSQSGITVTDIETLILQDADNLDAIGAMGIARTFAFGGAHGVPMWLPEEPCDRPSYDESRRDPSVLHHFHSKLLKLKENMNTETGKRMAEARHQFMQAFVAQFLAEWNGQL